jgi:5-(carboxyamino)imidazole ribonucleotide mutase
METAPVAIVMGSSSDREVMAQAAAVLEELGVGATMKVVSAHRTPQDMVAFGLAAAERGVKVIVAGAGGAAHLPGMLASLTTLPVIGVPIPTKNLGGMDSLLSIVQMPGGVPVATVAIGAGRNAGLLAARILAVSDAALAERLAAFAAELAESARRQNDDLS